ncbi:MAG: tetratricopeptide repeat protein [Bacteroidales bacterium]|nr:tetratricopeptide repeat protein [Bacteroidales bacterium]
MRILIFIYIIFQLILINNNSLIAQNRIVIDSLNNELKTATEDSQKVFFLNELSWEYIFSDTEKSKEYAQQAFELADNINYKKGIAQAYNNFGIICHIQGNNDLALEYYKKRLKISIELNDKSGISSCYNNMGILNKNQGNYIEAIICYQNSLKIFEELNDKLNISKCLSNIGNLHIYQSDFLKALDYNEKALKIKYEINDKKGIADCYNGIGYIYTKMNNYLKAIEYYQKALKIKEEIGDKRGISHCYNHIGNNYKNKKNYKKAIEYIRKSLKYKQEMGDKRGISFVFTDIADIYLLQNNYSKSIELNCKALEISKEIGDKHQIQSAYQSLSKNYEKLNNYKKAFEYNILYIEMHDSIFNEEKHKQIAELETKYQTEKKEQEIKLQKAELDKKEIKIKQQTTQKYAFLCGFILVAMLGLVVLYSYRQKKKANILLAKQNDEILQQKEEITTQRDEIVIQRDTITIQKEEITDSIKYAKRIQTAVLPDENTVKQVLSEHFVLFKPKDIVSGDFYWMIQKEDKIILVAADCTGHGVPGAFMSMLGISFLNEIIIKHKITTASEILNKLRTYVKETLGQTGETGEAKDGMDIALCIFDYKNMKLQYSGAYNPLYIIRNSELLETKADKMPIGIHIKEKESFTNHDININKGDAIYMFSDGYADQFGGENESKFKTKPFKDLLINIQNESMSKQKEILDKTIEDWKGNLEQIDDITVIGIRI